MSLDAPFYLHLKPGSELPELAVEKPFRVVIIIEAEVTRPWQSRVSDWLVASGCLYSMAWGLDCSSWDDSVDWANLEVFDYGDIPDERLVMTTWHEGETLEEVFRFCWLCANHSDVELQDTLLLHIGDQPDEDRLKHRYRQVPVLDRAEDASRVD